MMKRVKTLAIYFMAGCFVLLSQKNDDSNFLILRDLVGTVVTEESDSAEFECPSILADVISDYYAEATVSDSVADEVLEYVAAVFRDHGYHDTGNWSSTVPRRFPKTYRYVPYKGELPEYDSSDFHMPVTGVQTSGYGYRPRFGRFHHGIDVALSIGDTVKCVLPGVVTKTGYDPTGYGRFIVVSHAGGVETLYGHLLSALAVPGMKLDAGAPVGLGGATGNATGPHLHFEIRQQGRPTDPTFYLPSPSK